MSSAARQLRSTGPRGRRRRCFAGLVDDAALFPPGNATIAEAVPGHLDHARAGDAGLLGRFLCPASRLPELITEPIEVTPTCRSA